MLCWAATNSIEEGTKEKCKINNHIYTPTYLPTYVLCVYKWKHNSRSEWSAQEIYKKQDCCAVRMAWDLKIVTSTSFVKSVYVCLQGIASLIGSLLQFASYSPVHGVFWLFYIISYFLSFLFYLSSLFWPFCLFPFLYVNYD